MTTPTPSADGAGDRPEDDAFEALVARFHGPLAPEAGSDRLPGGAVVPADGPDPAGPGEAPGPGGWDDLVTDLEAREAEHRARAEAAAEEEDRYVPPAPPPIPRTDALGMAAWAGVIAAPVLWMLLALFGWPLESWQLLLLIAVFLGSFGVLVSRMRHGPGEDDPDDNGAVV